MATEIELKLKVLDEKNIGPVLEELFPDLEFELIPLNNVYFDTSDFELNQRRIALRLREKQGKYIQTLKTKGQSINGLHSRGEWEWPLTDKALDLSLLKECEHWPNDIAAERLVPVFETNFSRQQAEVNWQNSRLELAIDCGEIHAAGQSERINEIELELLSGDSADLIELGNWLQSHISVEQYDVSKAERGYRLYHSQHG